MSQPFPVVVDEDEEASDPQLASELFTGAHHFNASELKFTNARKLQKTKFVIYNSSGHLIGTLCELLS
jgi:hypothetical protein